MQYTRKLYLTPVAKEYIQTTDRKYDAITLYKSLIESNFFDNVTFHNKY